MIENIITYATLYWRSFFIRILLRILRFDSVIDTVSYNVRPGICTALEILENIEATLKVGSLLHHETRTVINEINATLNAIDKRKGLNNDNT